MSENILIAIYRVLQKIESIICSLKNNILSDITITNTCENPVNVFVCNQNNLLCEAQQESFYGNNANLTIFDSIFIDIPKCCSVTYTTSAGSINLPAKEQNWIFTQSFNCFVSNYTITSDCNIEQVFTLLTKTK